MAAYSWFFLVILIFTGALLYAFLIPSINGITNFGMNPLIEDGSVSESTVFVYNWNLNFFLAIPIIGLLGFSIWAITRAIEIAEAGNRP